MKIRYTLYVVAALLCARAHAGQNNTPKRPAAADDYATDLATVGQSQEDALAQAKQLWEQTQDQTARTAVEKAITEMEAAEKALQAAKNDPAQLPKAVTAEQAAYQALLKLIPHEYRVSRSRSRSASQSSRTGQPGQRQMDQLELTSEPNRYETERQAATPPTGQQREQLEAADRLKQLAQRQQDLNDRLRELQTALQQAQTEKEKEEIQRELKHLADEERQMTSDIDDLRQKLDQAPNSSSLAQAAKDLEQTRAETQQAARQLADESVSQALASGTRAQQGMQNLRENLRSQTSSQFSTQMRQLRDQARDLARNEEEIAKGLESLDSADHKALDNMAQRQPLVQQMQRQQSALTNLLANMQDVTEKAESSEPLLSEQLYDTLRSASQMRTDNHLQVGRELLDRGFVTKAADEERVARTNINELRQRVERAAESVLGSQSEALRYAQAALNDLSKQVERDIRDATTNSGGSSGAGTNLASLSGVQTNFSGQPRARGNTNSPSGERASARSPSGERGNANTATGERGNANSASGERGNTNSSPGEGRDVVSRMKARREMENDQQSPTDGQANEASGGDRLRELVQQSAGGLGVAGPILGNDFANWADRMRDVEQVVDSVELRNRLAAVRERVAGMRAEYRLRGHKPDPDAVKIQVLEPMTEIRVQLQEDMARLENASSLVPLDHDPVPDNYSELVRKYYEKLGGGQ